MTYTNLLLFALGVLGIFIHNLIKIHKAVKESDGEINWKKFFQLEWPSIALSLCVVIVCLIAKNEVQQLQAVGNWLGLSFVAIGYMAQSLVYLFIGRVEKIINNGK